MNANITAELQNHVKQHTKFVKICKRKNLNATQENDANDKVKFHYEKIFELTKSETRSSAPNMIELFINLKL